MVSCESKIIKILLGIFNLLWLLLGAGVVFIGVKLVLWEKDYSGAVSLADINLKTVAFVILAIGVVIALISFLGFFGACCENSFMLNAYGLLLILIIGGEIFALVYSIRNNINIESEVQSGIQKAINEINSNKDTALLLESLQYNLKCCGWKGPTDYNNVTTTNQYPGSCCGKKPENNQLPPKCSQGEITNPDGCEHKLHFDEITNLFKYTIGVAIAGIMFQLILVFAACCLAREIRSY